MEGFLVSWATTPLRTLPLWEFPSLASDFLLELLGFKTPQALPCPVALQWVGRDIFRNHTLYVIPCYVPVLPVHSSPSSFFQHIHSFLLFKETQIKEISEKRSYNLLRGNNKL